MEDQNVNELIQAAQDAIASYGDSKNHTVAAAIRTNDGNIITGINLFHFTGGPCAEMTALANAFSQGKKDLSIIVAVGDRNRGILAPCGRCRQVLFDYCPDIKVVVSEEGNPKTKTLQDLLPYSYYWNANQID